MAVAEDVVLVPRTEGRLTVLRARRFNAYKMIYTPLAKNNTRLNVGKNCQQRDESVRGRGA